MNRTCGATLRGGRGRAAPPAPAASASVLPAPEGREWPWGATNPLTEQQAGRQCGIVNEAERWAGPGIAQKPVWRNGLIVWPVGRPVSGLGGIRRLRSAALVAAVAVSVAALSLLLLSPDARPPPSDQPAAPAESSPTHDLAPLLTPAPDPATGSAPAPGIPADPPSSPTAYESSVNDFAFDLYRAVAADEEEDGRNIFFSPASIHTAFSVLYEGARDNTARQMLDAFGFEADPGARHAAAAAAAASIGRGDGHSDLSLANALWVAEWFTLYDTYLEAARGDAYGATVDTVDFADEADAVPRINAWASDNTGGMIEEVITQSDVNDLTAMVITNAIYFKGTWATPFPEDRTRPNTFTKEDGSTTRADFMEVTAEFDYAAYDGYKVLRMPYRGDHLSMIVALPGEPDGLGQLVGGLSAATLDDWIAGTERREVRVILPRFEAETSYDLEGALGAMGVTDAFDEERADLTGIGETKKGRLYVYKASHDAYVSVDEKGTEAAAVTTAVIPTTTAERPRPPSFVADHPFLFIIHDGETGVILFMGRLSDPAELR